MNVTNNQTEKIYAKKFLDQKVIVPYVMPGFGLAQKLTKFIQKIQKLIVKYF